MLRHLLIVAAMAAGTPALADSNSWPQADIAAAIPVLHCRQDMAIICKEGYAGCTSIDTSLLFLRLDLSQMTATLMHRPPVPAIMMEATLTDSRRVDLKLAVDGGTLAIQGYELGGPMERFAFQFDRAKEQVDAGDCARTPL